MPANRKVSSRQLEILVDFLETNRDLASGRCARGPLASQTTDRAWETVASKLNSVAVGVTKSASQWCRYWVEWKAKSKAKAADIRRNAARTGDGPNRLVPLNDYEQHIIALISHIAMEGHPEALLPNPFSSSSQPGPSSLIAPLPQAGSSSQVAHSPQPSASPINQFVLSQSPIPDYTEEEWLEDLETTTPARKLPTPPPKSPYLPIPEQASLSPTHLSMPPPATSPPTQCPAAAGNQQPQRIRRLRSQILRDIPQWAREIEERRLAIDERRLSNEEKITSILQSQESRLASIESVLREILAYIPK